MSFSLRPYQAEAIDSLWSWMAAHAEGNPIMEASVGAGKSLMIAEVARRANDEAPGTRVLVLVHQRELLDQNLDKLQRIWPGCDVGIVSASRGRKQLTHQITYATIGSIYKLALKLGRIDIVMADECHLINPKEEGMWRTFLKDLSRTCPQARVIGWTGTPFRGNGVWLTGAEKPMFQHVATRITMTRLLELGYLAPLVPAVTQTRISADGVRTSGDDYVVSELAKVTDTEALVEATCDEIVELGKDRKSWLVFAVTLAHAEHVRDALRARGVAAEMVSGETPKLEREQRIASYQAGITRCLVNVGVLTTGFDAPATDAIFLLRATKSPVFYVQIAGRGMRCLGADIHESRVNGKADCIAEGQRVLTDQGLVPIEQVTTNHKVWDGVEFVAHGGAIFKGEQLVIRYAGITATPDHRVWTSSGWRTLQECASQRTPILVGEHGGAAVREADRHLRRGDFDQGQQAPAGSMRRLRGLWSAARRQLAEALGGLQKMRQAGGGSGMAAQEVRVGVSEVHQPEQQRLRKVRRAWDRFRLSVSDRDGRLGAGELGPRPVPGAGPNRQRRWIQAGEYQALNAIPEPRAHAEDAGLRQCSRLQDGEPGRSVCGLDPVAHVQRWHDGRQGPGAVGQAIVQTKRRVWDILNAGPLHRFTCEGLIVSNCLWADFTSTTVELGPVDQVHGRPPAPRGGGQAPHKLCPSCTSVNPAGATICSSCRFKFPEPERIKHGDAANGAQVLSGGDPGRNDKRVTDVHYSVHTKEGSASTMRVEYMDGLRVVAREWVCFDHAGFPRRKAEAWWAARSKYPPPPSVKDAVEYSSGGGLKTPASLILRAGDKYPEIIGYNWRAAA